MSLRVIPVTGHEVVCRGAVVDERDLPTGDRVGSGRCTCGERSPQVTTDGQRRAWHRQHLLELSDDACDA